MRAVSEPIGILVFKQSGNRLLGDPGFLGTFPFPVITETVEGSYRDLIGYSEVALANLIASCKALVNRGAGAIAGDCGLMALYQRQLTAAVSVPVISSSLALLPLVQTMVPQDKRLGILTGHSKILSLKHFQGVGISSLDSFAIWGMENEPHFSSSVLLGEVSADYTLMKRDVLYAIEKLLRVEKALSGVLLECSNLASFSEDISLEFGLPVYDINLGVEYLYRLVNKRNYQQN